jgi:hypothetical protein
MVILLVGVGASARAAMVVGGGAWSAGVPFSANDGNENNNVFLSGDKTVTLDANYDYSYRYLYACVFGGSPATVLCSNSPLLRRTQNAPRATQAIRYELPPKSLTAGRPPEHNDACGPSPFTSSRRTGRGAFGTSPMASCMARWV